MEVQALVQQLQADVYNIVFKLQGRQAQTGEIHMLACWAM